MSIGEKIYGLRKKMGISQEELAQQLDVSRQAISKWERDEAIPDTDKIVALSSLFCISTDYLLLNEMERAACDEPVITTAPKKRWKVVIGVLTLVIGVPMGITSTIAVFVWRHLMSLPQAPPPPEMRPVFDTMNGILTFAPFLSLALVVSGILLLISYRKAGQNK
ncbi:helix-turn-helix domain-containing protein [Ruminococcaceae bacterium OttesenSCG-928-N02]|nr:helix-turn-helix domain-containing protein [Ruminococcaceae bacterium OttesenSCG-928-N02]